MAHVASCRFLRLGCSEDDHPLFRREYARSNRAQGVKLLRCFPHCCPEHAPRSYCGCSVHLLVTFSHAVGSVNLDELEVCTRFEPSRVAPLWTASLVTVFRSAGAVGDDDKHRYDNEHKLKIGEEVSLPESLFAPRAGQDADKNCVWVRGKRLCDAEQRGFPENTVLYAINNHTFPKWLYGFNSSSTRTQREMTHHLVVYVLSVSGSGHARQGADHRSGIVVARHASPAFYLVSLRRSRFAQDPGCDLPAINNVATENADNEEKQQHTSNMQLIDDPQEAQEDKTTLNHEEYLRSRGYRYHNGGGIDAAADEKTTRVGGAECKHTRELYERKFGSREKAQDLFILWKFLKGMSLRDIEFRAGIDSYLRWYLVRVANAVRVASSPSSEELDDLTASFLRDILEHARVLPDQTQESMDRESSVIRATVCLFVRASASTTIQRLVHSASTAPIDATPIGELQAEFLSLMSNVYVALDKLWVELSPKLGLPSNLSKQARSPGNQRFSLPGLVDEILSLVYGRTRFSTLRAEISAMLMSQQGTDFLAHALEDIFRAFTAQRRETMIASVTRVRDGIALDRDILNREGNARFLQSPFSCRWVVEPESVSMIDLQFNAGRDCFHNLGVVDIARLVREFGCVDVAIHESSLEMSLQSVLPFLSDSASAPMKLVLDGRFRVFRVLPSGLSSMIPTAGGWLIGDYVATISSDGRSLDLNLFAFLENSEVSTWNTAGMNSNSMHSSGVREEEVMVRRVNLSLSLEQDLNRHQVGGETDTRCPFMFVDAAVFGSTYRSQAVHRDCQNSSSKLSETSSAYRAALWTALNWSPLVKVEAKYVCARF